MKKEMLINVLQPEECRIAIIEDGVLEELYVERTSHESYVGNIYKGRIVNIEPSIQAAFVDFGVGRNGFLHVSDVEPAYYRHLEQRRDNNGRRGGRGNGGRGGRPQRRPARVQEEPEFEPFGEDLPLDDFDALPNAQPGIDLTTEEPGALPHSPGDVIEEDAPEVEGDTSQPDIQAEETGEEGQQGRRQESGRGRRRGRGRGRSRRGRGDGSRQEGSGQEPPTDAAAPQEASSESSAEAPDHPGDPPHRERPRFMDSAERRTEEEDTSSGPIGAMADFADEDLSFSRPAAPAPEAPEPPPAKSQEQFFEEEPVASPEAEEAVPELEEISEERFETFEEEVDLERRPARRGRDNRRGDDRRGRRNGPRRMGGRPGMGRPKPLIQEIFKRGQEVLVQVIKEGIGTKGPTLSTYISIAGRYLVLMPGLNRIGVSRKIADDEQRRRLRDILNELQPPRGLGFIIRTAGLDRTKKELQGDLAYLSRLWQVVVRRIKKLKSPAEIYEESDMITRTIRDTFTAEIDSIIVDEPSAFEHAQEFMQIVMPRYANRLKLYNGAEPMFHKYGIEDEIARIQRRHVPLPNGGSIVIDQTEALVAIDVNSGNFRADNNAEETAYQMNLLAAKEIARQLRLRDLGGVIVNDFIDMREEKHRRSVERAMREAVRRDRARTKILRISQFGLIEMTRQRIRPSLKRSVYQDCPHCSGTGQVKTCESMSIDVMRMMQLAAHRENVNRIDIRVHDGVATYLLNRKRKDITRLEEAGEIQVIITGAPGVSPELLEFVCYDKNNNEVKFLPYEENRPRRR
jgi:ribonuclease E